MFMQTQSVNEPLEFWNKKFRKNSALSEYILWHFIAYIGDYRHFRHVRECNEIYDKKYTGQ